VQARAAAQTQPVQLVLIGPAVGRFAMPTVAANSVIVHGDCDEVVPLTALLDWARPQQLTLHLLAGADHFFHRRLSQLQQVISHNLHRP
jgi:alpha/beta superfamily hydrolase